MSVCSLGANRVCPSSFAGAAGAAAANGVAQVYSNVRNFKNDLKKFKPHFLIVVPRLLETIWKVRGRVQKLVSFCSLDLSRDALRYGTVQYGLGCASLLRVLLSVLCPVLFVGLLIGD